MSTRSGSKVLFDTSGEESILVSDCSRGFGTKLYVHSSFAIIQFVFLVYRDGCLALPRGAMGLSSVCDCGISDHTHLLFLTKLGA